MGDLRDLPRSKRPMTRRHSLVERAQKFSLGRGPGGEVLLFAGKDRRERVSDCPGGEGPKGKSPGFASPLPTPRPGSFVAHPPLGEGAAPRRERADLSQPSPSGDGQTPAASKAGWPATRDDSESTQTLPPDLAAYVSEPYNREIKDHRIDWGEVLATVVVFLVALAVLQFAPPRCDSARAAPSETVLRVLR